MKGDLCISYTQRVSCALLGNWLWRIGNEQGGPMEDCSFHRHQNLVPTMLGLAAWIQFLHSDLSRAKSSDRLHFFRSNLYYFHLCPPWPIYFPCWIINPYRNLFLNGTIARLRWTFQTISNESLLIYHLLILPLNALECTHFWFYLSWFSTHPSHMSRLHMWTNFFTCTQPSLVCSLVKI